MPSSIPTIARVAISLYMILELINMIAVWDAKEENYKASINDLKFISSLKAFTILSLTIAVLWMYL